MRPWLSKYWVMALGLVITLACWAYILRVEHKLSQALPHTQSCRCVCQ